MTAPVPIEVRSAARGAAVPLHVVFPYACESYGIAGVGHELCDAIATSPALHAAFRVQHWVAGATAAEYRAWQRGPHRLLARVLRRWDGGVEWLRRHVVRRLLANCRRGDLAMVYPGISATECAALRGRGVQLVHDFVNTAAPFHWRALRRAYEAAGIRHADPGREQRQIAEERQRVRVGDLGFVCSPQVLASYEELGLPRADLVPTTCGWNPRRWQTRHRGGAKFTFLFAAKGSVRKGLPVLLAAWQRAQLDARLLIVGTIEDEVAASCGDVLRRPDVETRPFQFDLAPSYGEADAFVLPSFEEGSPLVGFLALGAQLPCIVSPAAAGWVMRDGQEALVVEPDAIDALVAAMHRVVAEPALREQLAARGRARADEFTWDRVAAARFSTLLQLLAQRSN